LYFQDCVYFSRGIFSPPIGALLDTEPLNIKSEKKVTIIVEIKGFIFMGKRCIFSY
jgi:hypothetical protein